MTALTELAVDVGTSAACQALALPRASCYRDRRKTAEPAAVVWRPSPARALRPAERETVLGSRMPLDPLNIHQGHIPDAAFDPAVVGPVETTSLRGLLLIDLLLLAYAADRAAEADADVGRHGARYWAPCISCVHIR
jgi:hypothetical protein